MKTLNALLVYPKCPDTFWSFKHALSYVLKKAAFPPLGLLTVAAMLPRDWSVRLIDMNVHTLKDEDITWADIVFVSAMIVQKDSAQDVIQRAKNLGKKVVVGGPYFSSCDKASVVGVDHFVLNEAEITLPLFLDDLAAGSAKPISIYSTLDKPALSMTPLPRWDLINLRKYSTMAVQFTRGCPFNCDFCDITELYGRVTRLKETTQFMAEMQHLYDAGWRGGVFIVDDNFVGNVSAVKAMLPHLIEWQKEHRYPFSFLTEASVNLARDEKLMAMMREAGFVKVFLGIETPNMESLKECHKGQNTKTDLVTTVETIQAAGMEVMGGFIVGFDSDTPGIFDAQIEFIRKTSIVVAMVGILNALPKTALWERLRKSGRLLGDSSGDNASSQTNFEPFMGEAVLVKGYKQILAKIYSPKEYYGRVHTLLANLKSARRLRRSSGSDRREHRERIKWTDLVAFVQSIVRIGIISRARFSYWRLILAHCMNRRTFPLAVQYAIVGEHFMKVSRKVVASG